MNNDFMQTYSMQNFKTDNEVKSMIMLYKQPNS